MGLNLNPFQPGTRARRAEHRDLFGDRSEPGPSDGPLTTMDEQLQLEAIDTFEHGTSLDEKCE